MDIEKNDFAKMKWPLHLLDRKTMWIQYADLKNRFLEYLDIYTPSLTNDDIVLFIVYCYHRYSPFVEKMDNIIERKVAILKYLNIEPKADGKYAPDIQDILRSNNEVIGKMIIQFVKFENSLTYFAFVQAVETFFAMNTQMAKELSTAKEAKEAGDVIIKLNAVEDRIDKLADKLFQRDRDLKDFLGSLTVIEGRKHKLVPEDYAI